MADLVADPPTKLNDIVRLNAFVEAAGEPQKRRCGADQRVNGREIEGLVDRRVAAIADPLLLKASGPATKPEIERAWWLRLLLLQAENVVVERGPMGRPFYRLEAIEENRTGRRKGLYRRCGSPQAVNRQRPPYGVVGTRDIGKWIAQRAAPLNP